MPFEKNSQLNITIKGKSDKHPTLLFIHGAGMDKSVWDAQSSDVFNEQDIQAAFLDLPGHGKSKGEVADSIEDMAADILHYVENSKFESVCFVGHSMGALVSLVAAASNSEKVKAVILCGVSNLMPVNEDLLNLAKENPAKAGQLIAKWSYGKILDDATKTAEIDKTAQLVAASAPDVLYKDLKACNEFEDGQELCPHIKLKPVMVISGEKDKMAGPDGAQKLVDKLPVSAHKIIEGAGHMMMREDQASFNQMIADFVTKLPK